MDDCSPTEPDTRELGVGQCMVFGMLARLPGTARPRRKTLTPPDRVSSCAILSRPARREERRRGDRPATIAT